MEVTPWAAPPPISLDLQAAQFYKQYIFLGDTHFGWRYDLNVTFYDVHPSGALKKTSWLFSLRTSNWFFFFWGGGVLWVEGESVLTDKTPNVTGAAQWSWWCWSLQSLRACYKSKSDFQCFFIFTCKIDVTQCNFSVIYVLDAEEGVSAFPLKKMNSLPPAVFPRDHKGGPVQCRDQWERPPCYSRNTSGSQSSLPAGPIYQSGRRDLSAEEIKPRWTLHLYNMTKSKSRHKEIILTWLL